MTRRRTPEPADTVRIRAQAAPEWTLDSAVLVYRAQAGSGKVSAWATLHGVKHHGRLLQLTAGVPATRAATAELARALSAGATLSGFVPPTLLYLGARCLLWWRAPSPARMFFDCARQPAEDQDTRAEGTGRLAERTGVLPQPGLVFGATRGGELYVFAVPGTNRPAPACALQVAPYFNVWAGGRVCQGNARFPERLAPDTLAEFEAAFFASRFTHPNQPRLLRSASAYTFWADLLDRPPQDFPADALRNAGLTLQQLAEKLEKETE